MNCETCRWWRRNPQETGGPPVNDGECRRFPPPGYLGWPLTVVVNWCGEWGARDGGQVASDAT